MPEIIKCPKCKHETYKYGICPNCNYSAEPIEPYSINSYCCPKCGNEAIGYTKEMFMAGVAARCRYCSHDNLITSKSYMKDRDYYIEYYRKKSRSKNAPTTQTEDKIITTKTIPCYSCGNEVSERATSCPKCGATKQSECFVCNKLVPANSTSCPECGDPNPFEKQLKTNKSKPIAAEVSQRIDSKVNPEPYSAHQKPSTLDAVMDSGSKQWNIYEKAGHLEAVKIGFSWPAFFFTFLWALFKQIWWLAVVYFMYNSIFGSMLENLAEQDISLSILLWLVIDIPVRMICGYYGNSLFSSRLEKRGYRKLATLNADKKKSAIEKIKA